MYSYRSIKFLNRRPSRGKNNKKKKAERQVDKKSTIRLRPTFAPHNSVFMNVETSVYVPPPLPKGLELFF